MLIMKKTGNEDNSKYLFLQYLETGQINNVMRNLSNAPMISKAKNIAAKN